MLGMPPTWILSCSKTIKLVSHGNPCTYTLLLWKMWRKSKLPDDFKTRVFASQQPYFFSFVGFMWFPLINLWSCDITFTFTSSGTLVSLSHTAFWAEITSMIGRQCFPFFHEKNGRLPMKSPVITPLWAGANCILHIYRQEVYLLSFCLLVLKTTENVKT